MKVKKRIGLVAHDNRKKDLTEWVIWNSDELTLLSKLPLHKYSEVKITKLKSGPLGGDQQLGGLISEGEVDLLIFLWDPMQPQPHYVDVKALLRITGLYNIPTGT